jgi:hypothetical protein
MRKTILATAVLGLVAAVSFAQHDAGSNKKPLSPPAHATCKIGRVNLAIDYSAPSKRKRDIMGALVPYGKVWRTGANAATTLKTDGDVTIGDLNVPAGSYTLYTIPGEKEWTLIVNKQTGQWGTDYDQSKDLGRTKLKVSPVKNTVETFAIAIKPTSAKKGELTLTWENTQASAPVAVK